MFFLPDAVVRDVACPLRLDTHIIAMSRLPPEAGRDFQPGSTKVGSPVRKPVDLGSITNNWAWQDQAGCLGMSIDLFYAPDARRGRSKRAHDDYAKLICATCPVIHRCLSWAMEVGEPDGIWGGLTIEERDALQDNA